MEAQVKRGRGRPKGSKDRAKRSRRKKLVKVEEVKEKVAEVVDSPIDNKPTE